MPEMFLGLDSSADNIKGKPGCPLTLWGDGPIVDKGLESLPVFTLKYHFKLLSAIAAVISFFGINVEGLQIIYGPGVEDFPVL